MCFYHEIGSLPSPHQLPCPTHGNQYAAGFVCVLLYFSPHILFYGMHLSVYSCIYWVIHSVQMGTLQRSGAILEQNLSPTPLPPGSHHLPSHSCDVYLRCVRESTEVNGCPTIPVTSKKRKHRGSHDPPSHSCDVLRCKRAQGLALFTPPFL